MKLRTLFVLAAALVMLSVTFASAATLGTLTTDHLGAGGDDVERCDNSFTFDFALLDNTVTEVTVQGIHADCNGGRLEVVLTDAGGDNIGDGVDTSVSAPSETVSINEAPAAADIDDVHVVIAGGA